MSTAISSLQSMSAEINSLVSSPPRFPGDWHEVVFPVDKPKGITSFDVIRRLRNSIGRRKMGHAGTLDPMATGLLICLIGRATKRMQEILAMPKVYTGTIRLGETTASYDADTPVLERSDAGAATDDAIRQVADTFVGPIRQQTPMYSAVRVGGERLYRKARRGESVRTPVRDVTVHAFQTESRVGRDVPFTLRCSSGTYVRSIAHDLGQALGIGAHLIELRRTRIGDIDVSRAWTLEAVVEASRGSQSKPGP